MSLSGEVKKELTEHVSKSRHCQLAELAAFLNFSGIKAGMGEHRFLSFESENEELVRKYFTLVRKTYNIKVCITNVEEEQITGNLFHEDLTVKSRYLQNSCCKRAFIRGAFLTSGSMSDPEKAYDLEFIVASKAMANDLKKLINSFVDLSCKITERGKKYVVYMKKADYVRDTLAIMGASSQVFHLEEIRIKKSMVNSAKRTVNCDNANVDRTIEASMTQIGAIKKIEKLKGLDFLPDKLAEAARLRLENPEMSIAALGELCDPPLKKSGINKRLMRIEEIASKL